MANSNIDALYPEFWATAFDSIDIGSLGLQNLVSRSLEPTLASYGDIVNVPLVPDLDDADDWTPGATITAEDLTQETAQLELDISKRKTIALTGKELSLSPYDLINNYGLPMAKKILEIVNESIYIEALKSKYFVNDPATAIDEDKIVDARTQLSNNRIDKAGRVLVLAPDDVGTLLKTDAFQRADSSGDQGRAMREGELGRKFGFSIFENNMIADYTPADVAGAINNAAGYAADVTTAAVDAFDDDATPIRAGDIFTCAGEAATTYHTILSTTTTTSDTTGLTFYPGFLDAVADNDVVTILPARSALAFVPSAMAFAARSYAPLPLNTGVDTVIIQVEGLPVRVSVWHDGKLGVNVQYDILCGVKLVNQERMVRIIA